MANHFHILNLFIIYSENKEDMEKSVFKTERLILRPLKLSDFDDVWEYDSDYEVVKYMYELSVRPGEVMEKQESKDYLSSVEEEWKKENPDFCEFAIELADSASGENGRNKVIGNICLFIDKDRVNGEFGWMLNRKYQNKGYATEAAECLKNIAFNELGFKSLRAHCDERNKASRRVMEKLGMSLVWEHGYRKYPRTGEESTELLMEVKSLQAQTD